MAKLKRMQQAAILSGEDVENFRAIQQKFTKKCSRGLEKPQTFSWIARTAMRAVLELKINLNNYDYEGA